MATGPEHYRKAEAFGREAEAQLADDNLEAARLYAELGTLHATLANAAATALNDNSADEGGMPLEDYDAWVQAAAVWQPKRKGGTD